MKGIKIAEMAPCYEGKCIVFDKSGIPWVIDPAKGTVSLARITLPATKPKGRK